MTPAVEAELDMAAAANLSGQALDRYFAYKSELRDSNEAYAESCLRGFIWDESEEGA